MTNADKPAMPAGTTGKRRINQNDPGSDFVTMSYSKPVHLGLTKREHFAAMALQGLLSNPATGDSSLWDNAPEWANQMTSSAVEFADALLAEMEQKKVKP
jgi:hypothetical protein